MIDTDKGIDINIDIDFETDLCTYRCTTRQMDRPRKICREKDRHDTVDSKKERQTQTETIDLSERCQLEFTFGF